MKRVPLEIRRESTVAEVAVNTRNVESDSRERKWRRHLPIAKSTLAVKAGEDSTGEHQPEVAPSRATKKEPVGTDGSTGQGHSQLLEPIEASQSCSGKEKPGKGTEVINVPR